MVNNMTMPTKDKLASFLPDLSKGYYSMPESKSKYTGEPQTKEEEAWILDYMQSTGRAPTLNEANTWMKGQDTSKFIYRPESTMGGLGFKNFGEYRAAQGSGESYGPWSGRFVPEGGLVTTDEFGNPIGRYMDWGQGRKTISSGQFIAPPGGFTPEQWGQYNPTSSGFRGGKPTGDIYPQYDRSPYKALSQEEALGRYSPQQVYTARLLDFVESGAAREKPLYENITSKLKEIDQWNLKSVNETNAAMVNGSLTADQGKQKLNEIAVRTASLKEAWNEKLQSLEYSKEKVEDIQAKAGIVFNEQTGEYEIGGEGLLAKGYYDEPAVTPSYAVNINDLTQEKLDALLKQAQQPPGRTSKLPLFNEVQGIQGANTAKLYQDMEAQMRAAYDQAQGNIPLSDPQQAYFQAVQKAQLTAGTPTRLEGIDRYGQPMAGQPLPYQPITYTGPGAAKPETITGKEQPAFYAYVDKLGVAPQYKTWLGARYQQFYYEWLNTGMLKPFVEWVQEYLAGGE